jgi:hypothetical protein
MNRVPILVIAFNRPKTLKRLLESIESLEIRDVQISVDGNASQNLGWPNPVIDVAKTWRNNTKHRVTIIERSHNFGIYEHLPAAMKEFFQVFDFGIILEDDMEFTPAFIDILDRNIWLISENNLWSIGGHNPINTEGLVSSAGMDIPFRPSIFHSIWGWATSRDNALYFVRVYNEPIDMKLAVKVLEKTSRIFTRDPFLQRGFVLTWCRKLNGWNSRRKESGWDTRWAYEGWKTGQKTLLPDFSLSRETLDQSEGQTHLHSTIGDEWNCTPTSTLNFRVVRLNKRFERRRLQTWGVKRIYCWIFAKRISNQLKAYTQ